MDISDLWFDAFWEMIGVGGGRGDWLLSNPIELLKRALELLISSRMSCFRSLCDNFVYTKCLGQKKK